MGMRPRSVRPPTLYQRFAALIPRDEHVLGPAALASLHSAFGVRFRFFSLLAVVTFAAPRAAVAQSSSPTLAPQQDDRVAVLLGAIDARRIRSSDSALVSFGTRNTYSDTVSRTRGIGAARRWIHAQLSQFSKDCGGCLLVEYDTGTMQTRSNPASPQRRITNVLAWLPGRDTSRVMVSVRHSDPGVCADGDGGGGRLHAGSTGPGSSGDGWGGSPVIELG